MAEKFEMLRKLVSEHLRSSKNAHEQHGANQHLYGVAVLSGLIAMKRGLDTEICKAAGLLHDLWLYCNLPLSIEDHRRHGEYGSIAAREILTGIGAYSSDEIEEICKMIHNHNDKDIVHDPYDEVLKDADAMTHFINNSAYDKKYRYYDRHTKVLGELGVTMV